VRCSPGEVTTDRGGIGAELAGHLVGVRSRANGAEHCELFQQVDLLRDGVIRFLRSAELPLAAWGDLDADGIRIITDVGNRVDGPVRAVGMSTRM